MATKFFLLSLTLSTLLQISISQTVHQVGGALNWIVPPGGSSAYSTWAANQTFSVGDILVFNFDPTRHDVTKVTKSAYDGCNTANPISRSTSSPANITLNSAGQHYFICSFTGHCAAGQKLAVNVGSGSPSPSPSPSPRPTTPSPSPSSVPPSAEVPTASAPAPATNTESPATANAPSTPTTTTPSSPSPDGGATATPPSPGNSAKSIGAALSLTVLAVCVGFLY